MNVIKIFPYICTQGVFSCIFHVDLRSPPHHHLQPECVFLRLFCLSAPRPPSLRAAARVCGGGLRRDIHNLSPTFHATLCALACVRPCVRVRSIIFRASSVSCCAKIEFQRWGFTSDGGLCVNGVEARLPSGFQTDLFFSFFFPVKVSVVFDYF